MVFLFVLFLSSFKKIRICCCHHILRPLLELSRRREKGSPTFLTNVCLVFSVCVLLYQRGFNRLDLFEILVLRTFHENLLEKISNLVKSGQISGTLHEHLSRFSYCLRHFKSPLKSFRRLICDFRENPW